MLDITKTSLALRSNLDTDFKNSDAPISKNVRKIKEEYINHIHTYTHTSVGPHTSGTFVTKFRSGVASRKQPNRATTTSKRK